MAPIPDLRPGSTWAALTRSPSPSASTSPEPLMTTSEALDWFVGTPIKVAIVVVGSIGIWLLIVTLIKRVARRAVEHSSGDRLLEARRATRTEDMSRVLMQNRRQQRAEAIAALLKSLTTVAVVAVAGMLVLAQFDLNLGPLIASAGIIGAAIGFGAQNLIKDYVSGISVILEDQYGVGDIVDLGPAVGTVENVTLRVTQLRDLSGIVWYVRNGEILRVANRSKGWTVSVVDVPVAYSEDLTHVREIIERVANDMDEDPRYDSMLLERPAYAGVESVSGDAMFVRVTAKSAPDQQVSVSRAIRERLKLAFDAAGIKVPVLARPSVPGVAAPPGTMGSTGTTGSAAPGGLG